MVVFHVGVFILDDDADDDVSDADDGEEEAGIFARCLRESVHAAPPGEARLN